MTPQALAMFVRSETQRLAQYLATLRVLPRESGPAGNAPKKGIQTEARLKWTPSIVTKLTDSAALANNEV